MQLANKVVKKVAHQEMLVLELQVQVIGQQVCLERQIEILATR